METNSVDTVMNSPPSLQQLPAAPTSFLESLPTSVAAASNVAIASTPIDPNSIPIKVPHGTPPPPIGQLLPEVAAAEQSPMKVSTPPPSTPSPPAVIPATLEPTSTVSDMALPDVVKPEVATVEPELGLSLDAATGSPFADATYFDDEMFKADGDGDILMNSETGLPVVGASPHVAYQHSPISFAYSHDEDGPPPAKRQKLDSVSSFLLHQPCGSNYAK